MASPVAVLVDQNHVDGTDEEVVHINCGLCLFVFLAVIHLRQAIQREDFCVL
jgi:hypothetical protein